MESAGSGSGHAATPVRYVALPPPRGVRDGGGWNVLVPESMASEWTVAHVRGVVRVASRGGGAPEVSVDMAALQAALNGPRRGDDPDHLHLRSGHRGVGGGVAERGGGGGAGGPCYVPVVFVLNTSKEAEKKEVKYSLCPFRAICFTKHGADAAAAAPRRFCGGGTVVAVELHRVVALSDTRISLAGEGQCSRRAAAQSLVCQNYRCRDGMSC